jgi:hypothetical protein
MIKKTLLLGLVASTLAISAHAAPGIYVNAGAGIGGMDTKQVNAFGGGYKLRNGVAYRASLGYLMGEGNINYGAELGYTGYPTNKYSGSTTATYSGHTVDLLGVGKYNFSDTDNGFFVVGKAGLARVYQRTKASAVGFANSYSKNKTAMKPELAVGAGYNVNKNVALDVTFSHIFGAQANPDGNTEASVNKVSAVNTLMAGITYNFS